MSQLTPKSDFSCLIFRTFKTYCTIVPQCNFGHGPVPKRTLEEHRVKIRFLFFCFFLQFSMYNVKNYNILQIFHVFFKYGKILKMTEKDRKNMYFYRETVILYFMSGFPASGKCTFFTRFLLLFIFLKNCQNVKMTEKSRKFARKPGKHVILQDKLSCLAPLLPENVSFLQDFVTVYFWNK